MPLSKYTAAKEVQRAFAALLLKAMKEGEVRVETATPGAATHLRMQIYAFNKSQRALEDRAVGRADLMPPSSALMEAIAGTMLQLEGKALVVRRRLTTGGMQSLLDAVGGAKGIERLTHEAEVGAAAEGVGGSSLQRVLKAAEGAPPVEPQPPQPADRADPYGLRKSRGD